MQPYVFINPILNISSLRTILADSTDASPWHLKDILSLPIILSSHYKSVNSFHDLNNNRIYTDGLCQCQYTSINISTSIHMNRLVNSSKKMASGALLHLPAYSTLESLVASVASQNLKRRNIPFYLGPNPFGRVRPNALSRLRGEFRPTHRIRRIELRIASVSCEGRISPNKHDKRQLTPLFFYQYYSWRNFWLDSGYFWVLALRKHLDIWNKASWHMKEALSIRFCG